MVLGKRATMNDILAKISSYNIFNNLVPGAVLAFLLATFEIYTIDTKSIVTDLIVFYFMGLVISRVGSLVVEPLFKLTGLIKYADYKDYLTASAKDARIFILIEENNQYRTLVALIVTVILVYFAKLAVTCFMLSASWVYAGLTVALLVLFTFSYRKQTDYIRKRVEHSK
jgi:hypothetical protein